MNCNLLYSNGEYFWRVIYKDPTLNLHVAIRYNEKKSDFPIIVDEERLNSILEGYEELLDDPLAINPINLREEDTCRIEKKYEQIRELIEAEPYIYNRSQRNRLIKNFLRKYKYPSKNTIYSRLKKLWSSGSKWGLFANYADVGKNTKYNVKPGPISSYQKDYLVTDDDKRNIQRIIEAFIKDREIDNDFFSYSAIYEIYLQEYSNGTDDTLSQFQFNYHAKKIYVENKYKEKSDSGDHNRNKRAHFGTNRDGVLGIGHTYFIDATVLNLNLVALNNPNQCIGKPLLFLVVDVYSHYIIGYYLGLENENYQTSSLALLNAFTSKQETLNKYDLTKNNIWYKGRVPAYILGDKGPNFSKFSDAVALELGAKMLNAAARRPDLKGLIESLIKSVQYQVYFLMTYKGVNLPLKRSIPRISLDTMKLTSCNFEICEQAVLVSINRINNRYRLKYSITQEMRQNNIKPIPAEIFRYNKSVGNIFGNSMYEYDYLKKMLLCNITRVYGQSGISFHNTAFKVKDDSIHTYLSDKNIYKHEKYSIFYNPSDFNEFYLLDEGKFYQLEAFNHEDRYYKSFYEFIYYRKSDAIEDKINKKEQIQNSNKPAEEIQKQLEESKSKKDSKHNTNKNIRENRESEKARINQTRKDIDVQKSPDNGTTEQLDSPKQRIKRYAR